MTLTQHPMPNPGQLAYRSTPAQAFYTALASDADLHRDYLRVCSVESADLRELVDTATEGTQRQWIEERILAFAAQRGYIFSLGELYHTWFGGEDYPVGRMLNSLKGSGVCLAIAPEPAAATPLGLQSFPSKESEESQPKLALA